MYKKLGLKKETGRLIAFDVINAFMERNDQDGRTIKLKFASCLVSALKQPFSLFMIADYQGDYRYFKNKLKDRHGRKKSTALDGFNTHIRLF
jgi:hypothetical protein